MSKKRSNQTSAPPAPRVPRIRWGRIKCSTNRRIPPFAGATFELPERALDAIPVPLIGGELSKVVVDGKRVTFTFSSPTTCLSAVLYTVADDQ